MLVHKNYFQDTRVRRYAESLTSLGVSVDVICPEEGYITNIETLEGLRVFTIPIHHGQSSRISLFFEYTAAFILYFLKLTSLYLKCHYSIIHIHNMPDALVFAGLIPKLLGARVILDIHDPMPEVYISKYGEQTHKLAQVVIRLEEKLSCLFADSIITANSNFRQNLIKRGIPQQKITVINNYPDPLIFDRCGYTQDSRTKKEGFTLIYPGTIAARYGLDVPIRALPEIISKIPVIRLLIIGPNNGYKEELKNLVDQLNLAQYVTFHPVIPNKDVPVYLLQANIGIYPARKDAHMDIATPTKLLEYAAMGLPIISSRLKVVEDMFDDTSVRFFEPGNEKEFARCVIELYENSTIREELIEHANTIFACKYSWKQEFQRYVQVINQLLPGMSEKISPKENFTN